MRRAAGVGAMDVRLVSEGHKRLSTLLHTRLPDGPAAWRRTSFAEAPRIRGRGSAMPDRPVVLLNNLLDGPRPPRRADAAPPLWWRRRRCGAGARVSDVARPAGFFVLRFYRYLSKAEEGEKEGPAAAARAPLCAAPAPAAVGGVGCLPQGLRGERQGAGRATGRRVRGRCRGG
ncbi:hypothetical protein BU14_2716s0001 [Porphyra umbilicalis]|uniref:Brix domain-containing protein n=1 Tax=Porphyra umbilicalis TaxID=2786 RepID=A0A1X6NIP6_PORUM|nr:hypothetical protein BU14_2716s0001 [Porphyra umbilicalis]|eukprot:OSX68484.1 hypothetical protein BU14_2716s0001 [Porphyra umbilicalis]